MSKIVMTPNVVAQLENRLEEAGLSRDLAQSRVLTPFLQSSAALDPTGDPEKLSSREIRAAVGAYLADRVEPGRYGKLSAEKVLEGLSRTLNGLTGSERAAAESFLAKNLSKVMDVPPTTTGGPLSPIGIQTKPPILGAKEPDERTTFSNEEWDKIFSLMDKEGERFGLPQSTDGTFVFGSFNVRKMGAVEKKTVGAWTFFERILSRFDICNIQEVQSDMSGLDLVVSRLPAGYQRYYTDTTGGDPTGTSNVGMEERMVTVFNGKRVHPEGMGSDLSFDSSSIIQTLIESSPLWVEAKEKFEAEMAEWEKDSKGKKPKFETPAVFVDFVRTPSKVSFVVGPDGKQQKVLVVNAHLLYGDTYTERRLEFDALVHALVQAADKDGWTVVFGGDCNLKFDNPEKDRSNMGERLGHLMEDLSDGGLRFNVPHIYPHPEHGVQRTNSRENQTYDLIGVIGRDEWIPERADNAKAGSEPGGYDYGVFNFMDLFCEAVHGKKFAELEGAEKKAFLRKIEHDVSDHMPIWTRIPFSSGE